MTQPNEIIRIAAKGDGVTASGQHIPGTVPGDVVQPDGSVVPGPHRANPPCRHFNQCGGCQLQHADEAALTRFVTDRVVHAAEGQGIAIGELLPTHLSPPRSRRRATFHAQTQGGRVLVGFREGASHRLINIEQCEIVTPDIFETVSALRKLLARRKGRIAADIEVTQADQGIDLALKNLPVEGLEATEAMLDFARDIGLARLTLDQGYGAETLWEPEPVTVTLGGVPVSLPPGSFLQATADGEAVLAGDAADWLGGAGTVADLFAGLGTFAFALAGGAKVLAVEAARDAHLACKSAAGRSGRPVHTLHRDLFRGPLQPEELDRFDAVLLDPPRAGAREQIAQIAASKLQRVVYISCNPASWARDARQLADAGFRLEKLRPVGQFRWSTHVELASLFVR